VQQEKTNYLGGYTLNYDGTILYFSSQRSDGIGYFDIWYSVRSGRNWSKPQNLGMPVNSSTSEGWPAVSPDGRWLYFTRCGGMVTDRCVDCQMYRAKHRTGVYWEEPELLPMPLNTGHETAPRMMPDNQTLVFASSRQGGKGGMDLYWSRLEDGNWTPPKNMEFINTEQDEEVVSIPAPGNVAFYGLSFQGFYWVSEKFIPREDQPLRILQISGKITDAAGNPIDAGIQIYNLATRKQEQLVRTGEDGTGTYIITVPEGKIWDFSVLPVDAKYGYYSERFDVTDLPQSRRLRRDIQLAPAGPGTQILLPNITLDETTLKADEGSILDARKLIRMMQAARVRVKVSTVIPPLPEADTTSMPSDSTFSVLDSTYLANSDSVYTLEASTNATEFEELLPTTADMELIGWNRSQAVVDFFLAQGIPERFMEKGVITYEDALALVGEEWSEDRLLELVVIEVIP